MRWQKKGLISGKPEGIENGLTLSRLKFGFNLAYAQSESGGDGSWWNDPSAFGTMWTLALAEPTPIGEAVAGIVTGIVGII
ncbi:hypothetical protein JL193_09910 [Polaribacter batillariae]|uniref:Uncharacterized protein n=1 Tax=Polaribacter batillariae TaxID=2808900 RepID=A0ABX7SS34_9FLAO|nr:hypothetical protein [Polaribacter batillariae]QTD36469.1 hypothetical protein JL193_09910 [Polaribacter batillariae]